MEKDYVEGFRNVLRRLTANTNRDRYTAICTQYCNVDEEQIWTLCQKFWPQSYTDRNVSIEKYVANDCLDNKTAQKYLTEIHELLDKLGWERL